MPVGDVRRWRAADNEAAAAYRAALPDQRAAFVRGWLDDLARGDRSPVDVGNVLALLAAPRDAGVLDGLAADIESLRGTREGVMEGVTLALLAAVYFGRDGELRRRPLGPLGRVLLPLESDPRLAAVFGALGSHLKAAGAELPYVPGTGRPPVRVDVDVAPPTARAPGLLRDLRLGGHPVLVEGAESDADRSLSAMLGRHADRVCTRNELRALVAREFLVPLDRLTMKDDKSKLTWRADAGLSSLDTGSPGGVRAEDAGADDGDEDA
jgi:hypothetical protein